MDMARVGTGETCTLAVSGRTRPDGRIGRWYLRVTIPPSAAAQAGFAFGDPVAASREGTEIVVRTATGLGRKTCLGGSRGKVDRGVLHFEASVTRVGAPGRAFPITPVQWTASPGEIRMAIPEDMGVDTSDTSDTAAPAVQAREPYSPPVVRLRTSDGEWVSPAEQLVAHENARYRTKVRALTLNEAVRELRAQGREVAAVSPRCLRIDGTTVLVADLPRVAASALGVAASDIVLIAA